PGREVVGGCQAVPAAADDHDVVALAWLVPGDRLEGGNGLGGGGRHRQPSRRSSSSAYAVWTIRSVGSPLRSFAGTPAILPWASVPPSPGSCQSTCSAMPSTSAVPRSATEYPAS